jgi:hypothetical protein
MPPIGSIDFELHSPNNHIAGGGFFATSSLLAVSIAWEASGERRHRACRAVALATRCALVAGQRTPSRRREGEWALFTEVV